MTCNTIVRAIQSALRRCPFTRIHRDEAVPPAAGRRGPSVFFNRADP
jgi:hypothetical protein